MKKASVVLFIFFSCASVFAQENSSGVWTVSANGGLALPTGNFGKGDYANEKSGFAGTGVHLNIDVVYKLNKNWGIGVLGGYSQFGFKGTHSLADGYKEDSGTDSTTLYTKGSNKQFSILIGPYYSLAAGKKFVVDFRVLGGYVKTHLAGFQVYYEDYTDNTMTQNKASGGGFGVLAGAGIRYQITGRIGIGINADYFYSKPKINISYDNFVVNSGRRLNTYNETIGGITTTAGIAFTLGK